MGAKVLQSLVLSGRKKRGPTCLFGRILGKASTRSLPLDYKPVKRTSDPVCSGASCVGGTTSQRELGCWPKREVRADEMSLARLLDTYSTGAVAGLSDGERPDLDSMLLPKLVSADVVIPAQRLQAKF